MRGSWHAEFVLPTTKTRIKPSCSWHITSWNESRCAQFKFSIFLFQWKRKLDLVRSSAPPLASKSSKPGWSASHYFQFLVWHTNYCEPTVPSTKKNTQSWLCSVDRSTNYGMSLVSSPWPGTLFNPVLVERLVSNNICVPDECPTLLPSLLRAQFFFQQLKSETVRRRAFPLDTTKRTPPPFPKRWH